MLFQRKCYPNRYPSGPIWSSIMLLSTCFHWSERCASIFLIKINYNSVLRDLREPFVSQIVPNL